MTKSNYIIKNNEYKYYCNNNNTYINLTNGKSHSICKYQIIFNEIYNNYIVINGHSDQCLSITKINYENKADINNEIYNYNDYKEILLNILNSESLITYTKFKEWASELYRENE